LTNDLRRSPLNALFSFFPFSFFGGKFIDYVLRGAAAGRPARLAVAAATKKTAVRGGLFVYREV